MNWAIIEQVVIMGLLAGVGHRLHGVQRVGDSG